MVNELVVDVFCGGGGTSLGIEWATGRSPDIAINHDDAAIAMHMANHPETLHVREDVWKADLRKLTKGRRVGLITASPDCFPAGTMVLTRKGYTPIDEIAVGDEVLTHLQRWKIVTATMSTERPLVMLQGHGHPGLMVSAEHPFYARQRKDVYVNRRVKRRLFEAEWRQAGEMSKGWYWATPVAFPSESPPAVPVVRNRGFTINEELMWLAGRYVADGWTRITKDRGELVVTCGDHKAVATAERLSVWPRSGARSGTDELAWHQRSTETATQLSTNSRGLVQWLLEHFGHRAENKRIPSWVLGADKPMREAFLRGYMAGDGSHAKGSGTELASCTTVSKSLAFGMRSLAASLGYMPTVYYREKNTNVIEGRKVNAKPSWSVRWRTSIDEALVQVFHEDGMLWSPLRKRINVDRCEKVFNLSVEDDESYIADGLVVHNCTHFSRAKGGKPVQKNIRSLAWIMCKWAEQIKPKVMVIENVHELISWGPLVPRYACRACDWKGTEGQAKLARVNIRCPRCNAPRLKQIDEQFPDPARKGLIFKRWVGRLRNLGYQVDWKVLNAADYGAPTHRRRLFVIARRDGLPILWPEPTHCNPKLLDSMPLFEPLKPWRTAAECIDWSIPCPSIFERKKPLKVATMKRIAMGLKRYVIDAEEPFLVPTTHSGERRCHPLSEPMPTITTAKRGELAVCLPVIEKVSAFIAKHFGGMVGVDIRTPLPTTTSKGCQNQIVTANLVRFNFDDAGVDVRRPLPTITSNNHAALVYAFMVRYFGTAIGQSVSDPLTTLTTKARHALVIVTIAGEPYVIVDIGMRMLTPRELATAQGFPSDYILTGTKTSQVARIGNSVAPHVAKAIVEANYVTAAAMA